MLSLPFKTAFKYFMFLKCATDGRSEGPMVVKISSRRRSRTQGCSASIYYMTNVSNVGSLNKTNEVLCQSKNNSENQRTVSLPATNIFNVSSLNVEERACYWTMEPVKWLSINTESKTTIRSEAADLRNSPGSGRSPASMIVGIENEKYHRSWKHHWSVVPTKNVLASSETCKRDVDKRS
jgi:hypothetical protein